MVEGGKNGEKERGRDKAERLETEVGQGNVTSMTSAVTSSILWNLETLKDYRKRLSPLQWRRG